MAVRVLLVLGVAAVVTVCHLPTFASEIALWERAVIVNGSSPRPAFNLGLAYQKAGEFLHAAQWYDEAFRRAGGDARMTERIRTQFIVLEQFGYFACDSPTPLSVCLSL